MEEKKKNGKGIAAFVLGIISTIFSLFWYVSIPTGVLAIIFGKKSIKAVGSKFGKTGMILGIIGLSLCVFIYATMIIILVKDSMY